MPTRKESLLTIGAGLFVITVAAYFLSKWQQQNKVAPTQSSSYPEGQSDISPASSTSELTPAPAPPSHISSTSSTSEPTPTPAAPEPPLSQPMALEEGQYYVPDATSGKTIFAGLRVLKFNNIKVPFTHLINVVDKNQPYAINNKSNMWMNEEGLVFHFNEEQKLLKLLQPDKQKSDNYKLMIAPSDEETLKEFSDTYQNKNPQNMLREYIDKNTKEQQRLKQHWASSEYAFNKITATFTKSQLLYEKTPKTRHPWSCYARLKKIGESPSTSLTSEALNLYTFAATQTTPRNKRIVLQLKYFGNEQHGIFSDFIAWGLIQETDNRTYYLIEWKGLYQVGGSLYGEKQVFENVENKNKQEAEALAKKFLSERDT